MKLKTIVSNKNLITNKLLVTMVPVKKTINLKNDNNNNYNKISGISL